jgi:iron complex transport system substrate-binding protein
MRVVSLLPSSTETVAALGHADLLVGRSHECDHPDPVRMLRVVSRPRREPVGTSADIHRDVVQLLTEVLSIYEVDAHALRVCDPDLVITQDLCRVCAVAESEVEEAVRAHLDHEVRIVTCSPLTLTDVLDDVERVAAALGDPDAGAALRRRLADGFDHVRSATFGRGRPRTAVLEWIDPLMGCGNWAPELLEVAGGRPVLATDGGHTPVVAPEALAEADPEVLVIGPCGYDLPRAETELPLLQALPGWAELAAVRTGRVAFLDGSAYLNRPGPRLLDTAEILAAIVHGGSDHRYGVGWRWLADLDDRSPTPSSGSAAS